VHYWADLQSVHEFRCYDNIAPNAKCQRVLVLALCLVYSNSQPELDLAVLRPFAEQILQKFKGRTFAQHFAGHVYYY